MDEEGSVWSCGYNGNGELGVGDCNARSVFEKVKGIKVKQHNGFGFPKKDFEKEIFQWEASEKEMFQLLALEQNKQVKSKIQSSRFSSKLTKQQAIENILLGLIPMPGWFSKWNPIHEKHQELEQSTAHHQATLVEKQEQLRILQKEIAEIQQTLADRKSVV